MDEEAQLIILCQKAQLCQRCLFSTRNASLQTPQTTQTRRHQTVQQHQVGQLRPQREWLEFTDHRCPDFGMRLLPFL